MRSSAWGGEEFGVRFSSASQAWAMAFVEQLRRAVPAQPIAHEGNPRGCMTASFSGDDDRGL